MMYLENRKTTCIYIFHTKQNKFSGFKITSVFLICRVKPGTQRFYSRLQERRFALFLSDISLRCAALQIAAHTPLTIYDNS